MKQKRSFARLGLAGLLGLACAGCPTVSSPRVCNPPVESTSELVKLSASENAYVLSSYPEDNYHDFPLATGQLVYWSGIAGEILSSDTIAYVKFDSPQEIDRKKVVRAELQVIAP